MRVNIGQKNKVMVSKKACTSLSDSKRHFFSSVQYTKKCLVNKSLNHESPAPQAKIVDPTTGMIVPVGASGEIMIRGYCVMLEYWNDKAKTDECITKDRWYKTG